VWTWAISDAGAPVLGAISFLATITGLALALWGLRLTYLQAQRAEAAANSSKDAIDAFKVKVDQYSVYRDIGEALLAIDNTRRHLVNDSWADSCQSYEIALRAVIRVQQSTVEFEPKLKGQLEAVAKNMRRFCDRVDAALAQKGQYPNKAKVMSVMREHHEALAAAKSAIEREV
jgi:hypothetical protein